MSSTTYSPLLTFAIHKLSPISHGLTLAKYVLCRHGDGINSTAYMTWISPLLDVAERSSGFLNPLTVSFIVIIVAANMIATSSYVVVHAQTLATTKQNDSTFHSGFDTFVVPGSVNGYGIYEPHNSNSFKPGDKISLYVEPIGFSDKPIQSLNLMNFTADLLVSHKAGHVLTGFQNLPISTIISHHKNKELTLSVSITQTSPFPLGDYVLKYIIHDAVSGNSFSIVKDIKIANI